jgi:ketosteroid isomerase-like protein
LRTGAAAPAEGFHAPRTDIIRGASQSSWSRAVEEVDVLHAMQDPGVVQQLERIEQQLASAWKVRDCAGWGAMLADDWEVTHIDAQTITKSQALEMCRTGPSVELTADDLRVRVYGDTAIVTGRTKASVNGAPAQTVMLRFTDVFVRRGGRWLVVASHATRVSTP